MSYNGIKLTENWEPLKKYKIGEDVLFGDFKFRCTISHYSRPTLAEDADKWDCKTPGVEIIKQSAHGFSPKDVVYQQANGTWALAKANSQSTFSDPPTVVIGANEGYFLAAKGSVNVIIKGHGLTIGTLYYLSPTVDGLLTSTQPTTGILVPVLIPDTVDTVMIGAFGLKTASTNHDLTENVTDETFLGYRVYSKVFNFGTLPNTTTKNMLHGLTGDIFLYDSIISAIDTAGNKVSKSGGLYNDKIYLNGTQLVYQSYAARTDIARSYITIKYIKAAL